MTKWRQELWPVQHVLIVVAAAVILRIAFLFLASKSTFMHAPVVDASFFDIWARSLSEGGTFQNGVFFKPPFYAYLLSGFYKMGMTMISIQIIQMVMGLVTVLLTLAVGRLIFSPGTALIGALVTALLPILPFFEIQLLAESWTTALSMGALLLILMVVNGNFRSQGKLCFFAGLLMGLAALGRPNLMLLIAAIALWLWLWNRSASRPGTQTVITLVVGFLVAVSPATFNNLKHGEFSLISTNLGANLVAGNSDQADGTSAIPVGVLWDDLQLRTKQAGCKSSGDASRYLTKEALQWVTENPGRTLQLLWKKIVLMVNAQEARNNINPRWLAEKDGVFLLDRWWPGTWLMLPFALLGLIHYRRWQPGSQLLVWAILAQVIAMLPFFVNARFRLPLLPLLALFAAGGFTVLWELGKAESKTNLVKSLAVLGLLFVVVNVDWFHLSDSRWLARDHYNQGQLHSRGYGGEKPDPALAERHFRMALELDGDDVDANEHLGAFLLLQVPSLLNHGADLEAKGNREKADQAYHRAELILSESALLHRKALGLFPRSFRSLANLGTGQLWQGDLKTIRCRRKLADDDGPNARLSALSALNLYQKSNNSFARSLQINPASNDSKRGLAILLQTIMRLPPLDPAIEDVQKKIGKSARSR